MSRYDALWPLHQAITTVLASDTVVLSLIGSDAQGGPALYNGRAPDVGAGLPRVILGATVGATFDTFDDASASPSVDLHVWAPGPDVWAASMLWAAVSVALERTLRALPAPTGGWPDGVTMLALNVATELVFLSADADDSSLAHAVGRVTLTLAPA